MSIKSFITHERTPFFELARPYISDSSVVLDIGPGRGDFADHFGRRDFFMLEGNPESAAFLQEKHSNVHLGMLPKLPFENATFDVIHCSHVVEHLQPQIFYETLEEIDRCLKPGGTMIISAPMMWEGFYNDLSHVRPYNPSVYKKYLCTKSESALTRTGISSDYTVEKIQYRFRYANPLSYYDGENVLGRITAVPIKLLSKMGVRQLEKTGYTIILRKSANSGNNG